MYTALESRACLVPTRLVQCVPDFDCFIWPNNLLEILSIARRILSEGFRRRDTIIMTDFIEEMDGGVFNLP